MIVSEAFNKEVVRELELLLDLARSGKITAIEAKVDSLPDNWWISFKVQRVKEMPIASPAKRRGYEFL